MIKIHVDHKVSTNGTKHWFVKSNGSDGITIASVKQDEHGVTIRLIAISTNLTIVEAEGYRDGVIKAIEIATEARNEIRQ